MDILKIGHWGIEVEVLEVNGAEAHAFAREHTVEQQLGEFKGSGVGTNNSWVTDAIATNGDAGTIRIIFIRMHFTNYYGVADFLSFVSGDVMIGDEKDLFSYRRSHLSTSSHSIPMTSLGLGWSCTLSSPQATPPAKTL